MQGISTVNSFLKKVALTAASAAALASVSFAVPAQADKTHGGPAATVDTEISFFEQIGITHKKVTIAATVECSDEADIDLHGQFKLRIIDTTASDNAGRTIVVYKKSVKAKRVNICASAGLFRVSQKEFRPGDHQYKAEVYFDAQKNHVEADSNVACTWVGIVNLT
jgi:hypothetical protein